MTLRGPVMTFRGPGDDLRAEGKNPLGAVLS